MSAELARWQAILDKHWERFETREISFQDQRRCRVREHLGLELDDSATDEAYAVYQCGYEAAWRLLPGVFEFLTRTIDIPKVVVTNGQREVQIRKIRATGLQPHVIGIVTPSDCGHWKPSAAIFEAALDLLQLPASECLMIGDDLSKDIEPARRLGMRSFHVQSGSNLFDALGSS